MKGKVRCTCGWSWNKSDSSKKDMYICHECGRDNSNNMKNGGWLDNYNDSEVSLPEGFQGEGYNTSGRDYSPAWGGQFAMGGSIPGSVGFTYARTQGIPSEGKYAKKTLPSAQNGQEMQYYQEGLDWKPKTISKNGGWLNAYNNDVPKAQNGVNKKPINKSKFKLKDLEEALIKKDNIQEFKPNNKLKPLTEAEKKARILAEQKERQGEIREHIPQSKLSRAKEIALNPLTAFGYVARNESLPENFSRGERNVMDNVIDFVNPAFYAESAENLGKNQVQVFSDLSQGNFQDAGINQLMAGADALSLLPIAKPAGRFVKNTLGTLPPSLSTINKSKNIKEALVTFAGIPTERSLPRLSSEELKIYRQAQEIGRMRSTGKPISEQYRYALEQNIPDEHFEKVFGRTKSEVEQILPSVSEQEAFRSSIPIRERFNLERQPRRRNSSNTATDQINNQLDIRTASPEQIQEFADRVGMSVDEFTQFAESSLPPQTRDGVIRHTLSNYGSDADIERLLERTYNPNELRPIPEELLININNRGRTIINGQNPRLTLKETAIDDWERYVDNKVPTSEAINNKFANIVSKYPYYKGPVLENVPSLSLSTSGTLKNVSKKVGDQSVSGISSGDIFTGSLNTSHSSYLPQIKQIFKYTEGAPQFLGYKPMNHLGFLSDFRYSQDDIAKYLNTEIDQQISRGVLPKDILRPYVTNKDRVILPHYGIKQFQEGGVIKDDNGYWNPDNWGSPVEINSNNITMEGVYEPLLGISDTGDTKLMKPGKNYKFKGKKVTEYPMAKNGIRQEQKSLQNLDNLLNFTNYNKPQPGGWLSKYE